jgi:hypothetical protein
LIISKNFGNIKRERYYLINIKPWIVSGGGIRVMWKKKTDECQKRWDMCSDHWEINLRV